VGYPVSLAYVSVDHVGYPVSHTQVHPMDSSVLRMWVYKEEYILELGCRYCLQVCSSCEESIVYIVHLGDSRTSTFEQRYFVPGTLKLYAKPPVLTGVGRTLIIKGGGPFSSKSLWMMGM